MVASGRTATLGCPLLGGPVLASGPRSCNTGAYGYKATGGDGTVQGRPVRCRNYPGVRLCPKCCPSAFAQERFRRDVGLLEDGAQCPLGHVPGVIRNCGVAAGCGVEPDAAGALRADDERVVEARFDRSELHPGDALCT